MNTGGARATVAGGDTEAASLAETARMVLEDLGAMGVPPLPECYEVWFHFRRRTNANVVAAIELRQREGAAIDAAFISDLYHEHFGFDGLQAAFDHHYEGVMTEVVGLQGIARGLSSNASDFGSDVGMLARTLPSSPPSAGELRTVVARLVETATRAKKRNDELERELARASTNIQALRDSIKEIEQDAHTDFLTQLFNRRRFDKFLKEAHAAAVKEGAPLSLILCDVDHFKKFNDTWGHHIGDQVLKFVGAVLKKNTKGQDLCARYGGEEFAVLLPNTSVKNAETVADQIRLAVSRRKLVSKTTNEELGTVTISCGVAELAPGESAEALIRSADEALYEAKSGGRNRTAARAPTVRRIA